MHSFFMFSTIGPQGSAFNVKNKELLFPQKGVSAFIPFLLFFQDELLCWVLSIPWGFLNCQCFAGGCWERQRVAVKLKEDLPAWWLCSCPTTTQLDAEASLFHLVGPSSLSVISPTHLHPPQITAFYHLRHDHQPEGTPISEAPPSSIAPKAGVGTSSCQVPCIQFSGKASESRIIQIKVQ